MVHIGSAMAEKKEYNAKLVEIGRMLVDKRIALGKEYKKREDFIDNRSEEIFNGESWISPRHLANVELGKNWISIEKLIVLAYALEEDPVDLFEEIMKIYNSTV